MNTLGLTAEQHADVGQIVKAIREYLKGQINESVERRNFRQHSQQLGESFDDFLVSLRELATFIRKTAAKRVFVIKSLKGCWRGT